MRTSFFLMVALIAGCQQSSEPLQNKPLEPPAAIPSSPVVVSETQSSPPASASPPHVDPENVPADVPEEEVAPLGRSLEESIAELTRQMYTLHREPGQPITMKSMAVSVVLGTASSNESSLAKSSPVLTHVSIRIPMDEDGEIGTRHAKAAQKVAEYFVPDFSYDRLNESFEVARDAHQETLNNPSRKVVSVTVTRLPVEMSMEILIAEKSE